MDIGRKFLTKVVDEGQVLTAVRSGIDPNYFDNDVAGVYGFVLRYFNAYKRAPTRDTILHTYPGFDFVDDIRLEPIEYYIDEIQKSKRREILEQTLFEASQTYTKDPALAEEQIRKGLSKLSITQKTFKDIDIAEHAEEALLRYDKKKANPGVDGIPSGWKTLDYQTLGWHGGEFAVLVGEKYMGKSWLMIWLAYKAALAGERVLFVTKEMTQQAIETRFHSVYASVCYDSLRRGELSSIEEKRYRDKIKELTRSNVHFIIARNGVNTIQDIHSKIIETDATIVFGDSIYLFPIDSTTQTGGEVNKRLLISQRCKETALTLGVPFIVSVQAGRRKTKERKPDIDDIEWSNAFSQDADTVFFIHRDELDRETNRTQVHLLKSREGDLAQFYCNADFTYMNFDEREDQMTPTTDVFTEGEIESLF